jgi:FkbM family methyltransferase
MNEILLKQVNEEFIDLSKSEKLVNHYNKLNSYTKYIIDVEINSGIYEDEILSKLLNKDAIVIDAGANVGLFALHVLPYCKKIHCIEPTPSHFIVLSDVAAEYGKEVIECHEVALNYYDGNCHFSEIETNTTENKISSIETGIQVKCETLKTFLANTNIEKVDLLKLDIEGAEGDLLFRDPTIDQIIKDKCSAIYIECHSVAIEMAIIQKFQIMGFQWFRANRSSSHYFVNTDLEGK